MGVAIGLARVPRFVSLGAVIWAGVSIGILLHWGRRWRLITGLPGRGKARALDQPHTGQNCLLREMGFVIAGKHALRLRRVALAPGFAAPLLPTLVAGARPARRAL
jgi:hypothetical protein